MKIREIQEVLSAQLLVGEDQLDQEVNGAFSSDMMSDVLAFSDENAALLTGLCNPQVIRTVEMMDINCVIFVRGKMPSEAIMALAQEKNIVVMVTKHIMYIASGLLYTAGLRGGEDSAR